MFRELFERVRRALESRGQLGNCRTVLAAGAVALGVMTPSAALAASPGCQTVIDGAYTRASTTNYFLSHGQRFAKGDVVTLQYNQIRSGGTLIFSLGDETFRKTDASGTISVTISGYVDQISLTSTWQGDYSTTATCVPAPDVPQPQNQTVGFEPNSTTNTIFLGWNGPSPHSTRISTNPSHGTATIDGTAVEYTPDANYVGMDEFDFIMTNAEGDSTPGKVRIRIANEVQIVPADGSALPQATVDQFYSFQFSALNCVGTCRFWLSDNTFNDGDMTLGETGLLSGTPTTFNDGQPEHELQVYVTDDSGLSQPYDFTLPMVESAAPTASASTTTVSANTTDNWLDLNLGGAVRSITVVTPPSHGTVQVNGFSIAYTPALNFTGTDTLTFTADNNVGSSAPAAATIIVGRAQEGQIFPATGPLKNGVVGEAYSQQIEIVDQAATFTFTGTVPPGLSLDPNSGMLAGTPAAETNGQTYAFSVTGTGPYWWDTPQTADYTLTVDAPSGVTATDKVIEVPEGSTPLPVDLTAGATGGPFTDAALLAVEPSHAGQAQLTMGDYAALDPDWEPGKFYLKFIPNPNFKGTAVVRYALRGAAGVSNTASVTFTVPLGVAAIANQVDGLTRGFVVSRQGLLADKVGHPGLIERRMMGSGQRPGTINVSPSGNSVTMNFASSLSEIQSWSEAGDAAGALATAGSSPFNAWIDGSLTLHLRSQDGLDRSGTFGLVSMGADYLVNDKLLAGMALHFDTMRDEAGITSADGRGFLVGPYVSTELGEGVFLDASVFYGQSWNKVSNGYFGGDFQTERLLAKARLEGLWQLGEQLTLRPDATMVLSTERAGDYTVTNGLGDEITVAGFTSTQLRLSAGGVLQYRIVLDGGLVFTPQLGASLGVAATNTANLATSAFGTLGTGFTLSGPGNWTWGGNLDFGLDGVGLKSATAKSTLGVRF